MNSRAEASGSSGSSRVVGASNAMQLTFTGGGSRGRFKRLREQMCPTLLARLVAELIVADFDEHVRQLAVLAVHRDGEIGEIVNSVGLVVVGDDLRIDGDEGIHHAPREAGIAIVQKPEEPRTIDSGEPWREAVDRDQDRSPAKTPAGIEHCTDRIVERLMDLVISTETFRLAKLGVGRNSRPVAGFRNAVWRDERAVTVDHQPAVALHDERRV